MLWVGARSPHSQHLCAGVVTVAMCKGLEGAPGQSPGVRVPAETVVKAAWHLWNLILILRTLEPVRIVNSDHVRK